MSIEYDFTNLLAITDKISKKNINNSVLNELKLELNKFFKDSTCEEIIYTNTGSSGMFFGMCVMPIISGTHNINSLLFKPMHTTENKLRFDRYMIEIDSKLLDVTVGLNKEEILAILLHEVGHVVNDVSAQRKLQNNINYHISKDGVVLKAHKIEEELPLSRFGILVGLRKVSSMFELDKTEKLADQFVIDCGYGYALKTALGKTIKKIYTTHKDNGNKFLIPIWVLKSTMSLETRRVDVIRTLDDSIDIEPSVLMKKAIQQAIDRLKKHKAKTSDNIYINSITESKIFGSDFINKLKYSSLKYLEEDLYEFQLRINNIDGQLEAMDILRSLNMRLTLIQEYLSQEGENINKMEKDKLTILSNKYINLRNELVKKGQYDKHQYGLFVKYPDISNKRLY